MRACYSSEADGSVHDGADAIDERKLRASVVLGDERTMEQDPLFGFRILVDIAIKALSKAINDPSSTIPYHA